MSISNDVLVIAVVVALTFLMWLMLRETFGAKRHLRERLDHLSALCVPRDLVDRLRLRLLVEPDLRARRRRARASPACRRTRAMPAPSSPRGSMPCAASSTAWSAGRTARWRARRRAAAAAARPRAPAAGRSTMRGAACAIPINTLREGMTRSWFEPLQADVEQLKQSAAALGGGTVEERQRAFEARASDIRGRARNIAARSNQLGKSTAAEMRAHRRRGGHRAGRRRLLLLRPDAGRAPAPGRGAGRAAGRAQAARGRLQRRPGRRRQCGQEPVAQHRRLFLEPRGLRVLRRQAGGRPHRHAASRSPGAT